jgi:hypothetical protein
MLVITDDLGDPARRPNERVVPVSPRITGNSKNQRRQRSKNTLTTDRKTIDDREIRDDIQINGRIIVKA